MKLTHLIALLASIWSPTVVKADQDALNAGVAALASDDWGAAVAIVDPDGMVSSAAGDADPDSRAMTADTPIRIASITTSFTAAAILRLWEAGRLDLDAPISALIPAEPSDMLGAGGYDPTAITVRHLLMHSNGMADHAETEAFQAAVFADPGRVWTKADQLTILLEATAPVGSAGARYHYSDTGYVILGGVIERLTGLTPLSEAMRDLLGLDETAIRWEGEPSADGAGRAHQWIGEIDTIFIHCSVDAHGGSGIVASVETTARAYAALISGSAFDNPHLLETMLTAPGHPEAATTEWGFMPIASLASRSTATPGSGESRLLSFQNSA